MRDNKSAPSNLSIYERNMILSFGGIEEAEAMYLRGKDSSEPAAYKAALEWASGPSPLFAALMPTLKQMYRDPTQAISFIRERLYRRYFPQN